MIKKIKNIKKSATAKNAAVKKPAVKPSAAAAAKAERQKTLAAYHARRDRALAIVRLLHPAGASAAIRRADNPPSLATILDRVRSPKHLMGSTGPTDRDDSFMAAAMDYAGGKSHNPCDYGCDLGVASRLSSGGYMVISGDGVKLTPAGVARGKLGLSKIDLAKLPGQ